MNLKTLTIKKIHQGFKKKYFSVEELVGSYLKEVQKQDKKLNAFITVCQREALEAAKTWDKKLQKNPEILKKYPLLGIPVGIKDIFCTKGIKTTAGSRILENYIPVYDATVVEKLKKAGAVIVGKTNLDAWAHGSSGENSDFGPTKNPYDPERVPGGSSSGSAAAVAADMCLISTGSDTGGSIRQPAGFCGVVGLKPSYGRVSRFGVVAMASSLDCMGHFSKTVEDSALVLKVTAGKDEKDATSSPEEVPDYEKFLGRPIKNFKIGIPKEYFIKGIDKRIEKRFFAVVDFLKKKGLKIKEVSLPHTKYALAVYYIVQASEVSSNLARYDGIRYGRGRENFGPEAKRRIMLGTFALSAGYYDAYYLKAMKVRTLIKKDFEKAFEEVDLLLTPVSPTLPFRLGERTKNPLEMYLSDIFTIPASLAGIPGMSLPAGKVENLPVGIQILAPLYKEERIFQLSWRIEKEWQ